MRGLDMFDLSGKIALITGATGGIGGAIASAFKGQGAGVVLSGTKEKVLNNMVKRLGDNTFSVPVDLTDSKGPDALVNKATEIVGRIDILINNAGITRDMLAVRMKDEDWQIVMDINLLSAFRLSRACLKGMMKNRWGRIINITSVVGITGNLGQANYAASKAAMIGMSKSLAQEVAKRGITVNCIAPGFIETAMTGELDENQRGSLLERIPSNRMGKAEDISGAAIYLASNNAEYVTGQTLHVNGGLAMI